MFKKFLLVLICAVTLTAAMPFNASANALYHISDEYNSEYLPFFTIFLPVAAER